MWLKTSIWVPLKKKTSFSVWASVGFRDTQVHIYYKVNCIYYQTNFVFLLAVTTCC